MIALLRRLRPRSKRAWAILGVTIALVVTAALYGRVAIHLGWTALTDPPARETIPPGFIEDASRLNRTPVAEVWPVPSDAAQAEAQLRELLARARLRKQPVSIAGARHSMGGHTFVRDGLVIDTLPFNRMELKGDVLHVQAGARWSDVLPYLNRHGKSVRIMQGFNLFTVGGSMSVNVHGWQHDQPPFASCVRAFRLMKADGTVVRCTRTRNADLFSAALGGYGLFGVILDAEIDVMPNETYRVERWLGTSDRYVDAFTSRVERAGDVGMSYGRLSVDRERFLREAILYVLKRDPELAPPSGELAPPQPNALRRAVFRGSAGSDYGKRLRWDAEKELQSGLDRLRPTRNELLNEPLDEIENRSRDTTEILQEYFVPAASFERFLERLRNIIPRHGTDLLNATIRTVRRDDDTLLAYAGEDVFALVLYFHQPRTAAADEAAGAMTREIVDAALDVGGRYYLPYRLHASPEQFRRAYPRSEEFFGLKRAHDPDGLFQNHLSRTYSP